MNRELHAVRNAGILACGCSGHPCPVGFPGRPLSNEKTCRPRAQFAPWAGRQLGPLLPPPLSHWLVPGDRERARRWQIGEKSPSGLTARWDYDVITNALDARGLGGNLPRAVLLGLVFHKPAQLHYALKGGHIDLSSLNDRVAITVGFDLGTDAFVIHVLPCGFAMLRHSAPGGEQKRGSGQASQHHDIGYLFLHIIFPSTLSNSRPPPLPVGLLPSGTRGKQHPNRKGQGNGACKMGGFATFGPKLKTLKVKR